MLLLFSDIAKWRGPQAGSNPPIPFSPIGAVEHPVLQSCDTSTMECKNPFQLESENGFFSALAGIYESPRKLVNKSAMWQLCSFNYCCQAAAPTLERAHDLPLWAQSTLSPSRTTCCKPVIWINDWVGHKAVYRQLTLSTPRSQKNLKFRRPKPDRRVVPVSTHTRPSM